jgi:hypothetical protein
VLARRCNSGGGRRGPAEAEFVDGDLEVLGEQPPVERLGPGHLAAFPASDGLLGDLDLATEPALRELVERVGQVFLRQASVLTQSDQVGIGCPEVGWLGHDWQRKPPLQHGPRCPLDVPEPTLLWALSVVVRSSSNGCHWLMSEPVGSAGRPGRPRPLRDRTIVTRRDRIEAIEQLRVEVSVLSRRVEAHDGE